MIVIFVEPDGAIDPRVFGDVRLKHAEDVAHITKDAAELGLACHPDGEYKLDKLRHM
jgi:hypothetical protein